MSDIFPDSVRQLPEADIPMNGISAWLSQADGHQIIFMHFSEDVDLAEHAHESQWCIVLEGRIDMVINGERATYRKGDRFLIPKDAPHSGKIYAGYTDIAFFDQPQRYKAKAA